MQKLLLFVSILLINMTVIPQNLQTGTNPSESAVMFSSTTSANIMVTNTNDSGPGSLREALNAAATSIEVDTIRFDIPMIDSGYDPANGVWVIKPATTFNVPEGTTIDGHIALVEGGFRPGIEIDGTTLALSGMTGLRMEKGTTLRGLIVNRCQYGIWISSANVTIEDCLIGTDPTGTIPRPNGTDGILLAKGATGASIHDNIISGNEWNGIRMFGETTTGNLLRNNRIGTDVDGLVAVPNGYNGVVISANAHNNLIEHNQISGNNWNGIQVYGVKTNNNVLRNNLIGTDADGKVALANGTNGIVVSDSAQNNIIEGNVVSGNANIGIHLLDSGTVGNIIRNNRVGADVDGTAGIPNHSFGVALFNGASYNIIGPDNQIAFNDNVGVLVDGSDSFTSTVGNTITTNSIAGNGSKGIFNFRGGNTELMPPIILIATSIQVSGTSGPEQTIEIFSDENDQGKVYLGSTVANDSGNFTLMLSSPPLLPFVTATCTDSAGNTSEFSLAVKVILVNVEEASDIFKTFEINQNYPNPFNPTTTIRFGISERGNVRMSILNVLGEEIRVLLNEEKEAGYHSIDFNASGLPSGVYFYRIQAGSFIDTKKMRLLK